MKQSLNKSTSSLPYNKSVREAYLQILKTAKGMLATIEHEEMRHTLVREEKLTKPIGVIHEFINPLLYLRLECDTDGLLVIHYGFEMSSNDNLLSKTTAGFTRSIYRLTSKEVTAVNIEACVHNDWCITQCSELYEYVDEQQKHHQFYLIRHKPGSSKKKTDESCGITNRRPTVSYLKGCSGMKSLTEQLNMIASLFQRMRKNFVGDFELSA